MMDTLLDHGWAIGFTARRGGAIEKSWTRIVLSAEPLSPNCSEANVGNRVIELTA